MMKENSSKITIGPVTLKFEVTPMQYSIEKSYSYSVEPCLGQTHPLVSFEHGSIQTLQMSVILDEDLNEKVNISEIQRFLTELNRIDPKKRTSQEVKIELGPLKFTGFVVHYKYTPSRFKEDMTPTSVRFDFTVISSGEDHESTIS